MNAFLGVLMVAAMVAAVQGITPAANQLNEYKENTGPFGPELTTSSGAPVQQCAAASSLNKPLLTNEFLMDNLVNFARQRIPERVVHAQGTGAFGYFETIRDMSHICKADFLTGVGKQTPVGVRFSTSAGSKGSSDMATDTRGFSVKYYTCEGNFDMPQFNTPVSSFSDPIHAQGTRTGRNNPATNLPDPNMAWDRIILRPEILHVMSYVFAGYGTPAAYSHMTGFSAHTFQVENDNGDTHFIKWRYYPKKGIKNFLAAEAKNISAENPYYMATNLYNDIANGDYPTWYVDFQIFNMTDYKKLGSNLFSKVRTIDEEKYPYQRIGKLVLNRNPTNHFAEIEQMVFCPCHLVPGILGAPDKIYEARRFVYRDTQMYRLGGNLNNIPVNCPYMSVTPNNYNRDGVPPVANNGGSAPNYYPNSFSGPTPYETHCSKLINIVEEEAYNMDQVQELFAKRFTELEKDQVVENVSNQLSKVYPSIQKKAVKLMKTANEEVGRRIEKRLKSLATV